LSPEAPARWAGAQRRTWTRASTARPVSRDGGHATALSSECRSSPYERTVAQLPAQLTMKSR
jgi:hypothetical protein